MYNYLLCRTILNVLDRRQKENQTEIKVNICGTDLEPLWIDVDLIPDAVRDSAQPGEDFIVTLNLMAETAADLDIKTMKNCPKLMPTFNKNGINW